MAMAYSFFQKRESHKTTFRSGQNKTTGFGGGKDGTVVED